MENSQLITVLVWYLSRGLSMFSATKQTSDVFFMDGRTDPSRNRHRKTLKVAVQE